MVELKLKSHAKINLTIDVLARREDGYHQVEMIMQSISLADQLAFTRTESKDIVINSNEPTLPSGRDNLIYQAAKVLFKEYSLNGGLKVEVEKNIPLAAGLAGGSGNAAAALIAVNKLWNLNLGLEQLSLKAAQLGADIPFCLSGGTVLATEIGTKLERLPSIPRLDLVVIKPPFSVSTAEVYNNLDLTKINNRPKTEQMVTAFKRADKEFVIDNMRNILEEVTFKLYPQLKGLKKEVANVTNQALMSGSGPTILGFVASPKDAQASKKKLRQKLSDKHQIFTAQTVGLGVKEI